MSRKPPPLLIFLHVPKCAGSTLAHHIRRNLKPEEYLACYYRFNKHLDKLDFLFKETDRYPQHLAEAKKRLSSLSTEEKAKIKVVFGHHVPFGIHRLLHREAIYFTIVREPVDRTISSYNFQVTRIYSELNPKEKKFYQRFLGAKGTQPSFETWLQEQYDHLPQVPVGMSMTSFFRELGYLSPTKGKVTSAQLRNMVSKFEFIGLTETNNKDLLYLYHRLGISKFYSDKNVSDKYVTTHTTSQKLIREKNQSDLLLYRAAVKANQLFKKHHPEYLTIVRATSIKRQLTLPVTQFISNFPETIYLFSAWLKTKSAFYERTLPQIKNLLRIG